MVASDPNNDVLTYSATSLPTGLTIDGTSGLISGTATAPANFTATVTVSDGTSPVPVSFLWSIDAGFVCQVAGSTLSWADEGANSYYIRQQVSGVDQHIGSSSGLTYPLSDTAGDFRVLYHRSGSQFATACPLI